VYTNMHDWADIRRRVLLKQISKRAACREYDVHWSTLSRILDAPTPPGYQQAAPRAKPRLGPFLPIIHRILDEDRAAPPKQRHTATRIFHRLRDEFGYTGGRSVVGDAVRAWKGRQAEVFVPLEHRPGEAQADFGFALANIDGHLAKVAVFVMTLPFSDALFCCAFPRECAEAFQEGHARAFRFFGGVPRRISYDNTRIAVAKVTGRRGDVLTRHFLNLKSYYLFDSHFCLVRRANEKGHVENLVGFSRRNFLVPVPTFADFEALNDHLLHRCLDDLMRSLRGKDATKAGLLEQERPALLTLPETPFAACRVASTRVSSLSLVRFDTNDYSVPVAWGHRRVTVRAGVEEVRIESGGRTVAVHHRCWDRHRTIFDPLHYLALLERKPGALDYARPLSGWSLPECFTTLRERLEADDPAGGTVQYIRVLRLLESVALDELAAAVEESLPRRGMTADLVRLLVESRRECPAVPLSLEGRPQLQTIRVGRPDLAAYRELLPTEEVRP
jgi:transposase